MTVKKVLFHRHSLLFLLLLVLAANITLYYTAFGGSILPEKASGVVIGSIIDLALVAPFSFIAWKQKWQVKNIILAIAAGLVLVRFLIPMEYLQPFAAFTWAGFIVEGMLVLFEIGLLILLVKHLPSIVRSVKKSSLPTVFSFVDAVHTQMTSSSTFIKMVCTEMLLFYYAFASWKNKPKVKGHAFTLYKNSSLIAAYIMIMHSILIETIAIHWWLHA